MNMPEQCADVSAKENCYTVITHPGPMTHRAHPWTWMRGEPADGTADGIAARGPDRRVGPSWAGEAGARVDDSAPTRSPRTPTRTDPPCAHGGRTGFKGKLRNNGGSCAHHER